MPDTRLMVIGYGFKDHHINKAISHAVYKHDLRMFVVSPQGRGAGKVLSAGPHPGEALAAYGYDLEGVFHRGLAGALQRLLSETFGGSDPDHLKLLSSVGLNPQRFSH
jgi:hypothetical protein